MKKKFGAKFHEKYFEKSKLRFAGWFFEKYPGKYCWADCVMWSMNRKRYNPFKIDSSKSCEIESIEHSIGMCYCGGWQNGKCWDLLPQEERDRILTERKKYYDLHKDEIPF